MKATHPTIYAWRCHIDDTIQEGKHDDGEAAAGEHLAHILRGKVC